ncbi:hypothetical protein Hanom_Chr12g01084281 [Helianthus anomalus]
MLDPASSLSILVSVLDSSSAIRSETNPLPKLIKQSYPLSEKPPLTYFDDDR